ncbi:glutamine amidotransferase [Methylolobus aquaticus]
MKTAHVIRHVPFEDLGNLAPALAAAGFTMEYREAGLDDLASFDAADPDLLIVLGGPIGVYEERAYPFLADELRLLERRLAADRPTLGICLGAQLIAAALGARVYPGARGKEIGWSTLHPGSDLTAASPLADLVADGVEVLHWHGDTFDLPEGATHLAASTRYQNQAFAWGKRTLALQFHPEVTRAGLERWYIGHACELSQAGLEPAALRAESGIKAPRLAQAAAPFWQAWLTDSC